MKWIIGLPLVIAAGAAVTFCVFRIRALPEVPLRSTPSPTALATRPTSTPHPSSTSRQSTSNPPSAEQALIQELQSQWQSISNSIPVSPTLGSRVWELDAVQFIGNSRMLMQFEDGHVVNAAILEYADHLFKVIHSFPESDFSYSDWEQVVKQYGDPKYAISNYAWSSASRSYAKVSENVFISSR